MKSIISFTPKTAQYCYMPHHCEGSHILGLSIIASDWASIQRPKLDYLKPLKVFYFTISSDLSNTMYLTISGQKLGKQAYFCVKFII